MGKVAFVFAGQGAQYPGMGQELAQAVPAAAEVFQRLDALRPGTSQQCFAGTAEELKETRNTQPCMFAVELAAAAALEAAGVRADLAAGFSLGEVAALAYTGAVDLDTGFRLVCRRGELMQQAAEAQPTAMAAVVKLPNETVEALCAQFPETYPVNYNCPGQVSVACAQEQLAPLLRRGEGRRRPGPAPEGGGGLPLPLHGLCGPGLCPGAGRLPGGPGEDPPVFQQDRGGLRRGPQGTAGPADRLPGAVGDHREQHDRRRGGHVY